MTVRIITFLLLINTPLFAQSKYARVKVFLHNTHISELAELGLEYDHGVIAKGQYWINDVSAEELDRIRANGLSYEVLIEDVQQWYVAQNEQAVSPPAHSRNNFSCQEDIDYISYETPTNYTYGSMGGYHTFEELLDVLDDMKAKFPQLISEKQPIGNHRTYEGRPIYWLKVGVNPDQDEVDKPEILYTALHHAREPNSLSQMLFFIWYLLENYETDEEVTYLLENVELYFIPCINPDGYVFNERAFPNGGGLWRKNRWVNSQSDTTGVDLNRNYDFKWALDDIGSSSDLNSEVFRGTAPFSEPETKAVRDFCKQHHFKIALNYHSFSNLLVFPWGFDDTLTPDAASFQAIGQKLTEQNRYITGTALETVGYLVNGVSDDWMYGDEDCKPKILSMTPEVGPQIYGYWPPKVAIDQLNKDNVWQNRTAAALLKPYGDIIDLNPRELRQTAGVLSFELQNIGLERGTFTVSVHTVHEDIQLSATSLTTTLNHLEKQAFTINYTLLQSQLPALEFDIHIHNGDIERTITIRKTHLFGVSELVMADEVSANLSNWHSDDGWAATSEAYYSDSYSITDSPNSNYKDFESSTIQSRSSIDLTEATKAFVRFRGKWALEPNYDFVYFFIGPATKPFIPLCGQYTLEDVSSVPGYTGIQEDWVLEEIDISAYAGEQVFFSFSLESDYIGNEDGFYFDDFEVEIFKQDSTTALVEPSFFSKDALQVTPNPFTNQFVVDITLQQPTPTLTLKLVTLLGKEIALKQLDDLPAGVHQIPWEIPATSLPNGLYLLQVQGPNQALLTYKIQKIGIP